jgi:hypothetical protein
LTAFASANDAADGVVTSLVFVYPGFHRKTSTFRLLARDTIQKETLWESLQAPYSTISKTETLRKQ